MKKIIFFLFAASTITFCTAQNIGIGTNSPSSSAMLDVNSTTKGLLIPRMTSAQRGAIVSPANGLMVYDITTNSFWYYNNSTWSNLYAGGGGSFTLPYNTTVALTSTAFKIKNDESYNAIEGESTYGTGVSGISAEGPGVTGTSLLHNGVYGYSASGTGVYAKSGIGTGLYAHSSDGPGISAASNNSSAIIASLNNSNPVIVAVNNPGIGIKGTSNTNTGIEGNSTSGSGVYANSTSGAGLNALSGSGYGIIANSTSNSSIYAFSSNAQPTINATNNNGTGVAIKGSSSSYNGVMGTSGGTSTAGVRGEATGLGGNGVFGTTSSNQGYGVYGHSLTGTGLYGFSNTGTGIKAVSNSSLALDVNGNVKIAGGNTTPSNGAVLTSDATGNASWKNNKVAFRAENINTTYSGISSNVYTKVHFDDENYDYANNYFLHVGSNPVTNSSTFTVPKTGVYTLGADVSIMIFDATYNISQGTLNINRKRAGVTTTIAYTDLVIHDSPVASTASGNTSTDLKLQAGDIIWVEVNQVNGGSIAGDIHDGSFFAHLVFED